MEGPWQGCQTTIVPCRCPSPALPLTAPSHTDGSQARLDSMFPTTETQYSS